MDTQVNSYPFELIFYQAGRRIPVTAMETDEHFFDENTVVMKENTELSLLFNCPDPNAKLYIAGFEILEIAKIDADGNSYLHPSDETRLLFQNYDTHYPLIPGFYPIKVVAYQKSYFSTLHIEPKQITQSQWEYMKDELEKELKGLAQDFIQNQFGLGRSNIRAIPVKLLYQFELILKSYSKVMISLNDIALKPRYKIKKEYKLTWLSRAKYIDEHSLRYQLTHPDKKELIPAPINMIDYDLLENRWIQKIVKTFIHLLDQFMEAIDGSILGFEEECKELEKFLRYQKNTQIKYREKKKAIQTLHEYREKSRSMKRNFERFFQSPWLKDVSKSTGNSYSNVLNLDSRYRIIYQLYRKIVSDQFHISIESSFASQWKKTDLLYEIWGYMHICKTLISLDYQPKQGWLYSYTKNFFVPTLQSGTRVTFEKDDLTLHLIYDQSIPRSEEKTDLETNPLYTVSSHNCPDGRIDVYKEGIYIGSLIFDFKYRQLDSIWNHYTGQKVINQLTDYQAKTSSPYIYGDLVSKRMKERHYKPASVVWGLYPSRDLNSEKRSQKHWNGIVHLLRLCPGDDTSFIEDELEDVIDNMLQDYLEVSERHTEQKTR
ncbi:DUF2357 domain-containing protein [Risungbinella massiliensis]|uniref:DUF2357 domain-containing protein n=1 Tax=Risungbinella massiliensis TaxID=1329796 RepID=UPI0005CC7F4E|nr:DUF2357 domain-containing protein [Risungbinella massiliensis]